MTPYALRYFFGGRVVHLFDVNKEIVLCGASSPFPSYGNTEDEQKKAEQLNVCKTCEDIRYGE